MSEKTKKGETTVTIEEILTEAVQAGASDVHITAGIPPKMRVNGNLLSMSQPRLLPADTLALLVSVMSQSQRERFEERGEYDMSFAVRELGRFRVNAYKQRGCVAMAIRLIGAGIPSPKELGLPWQVTELYQRKSGLILVAGPAGSGKSTTLAALIDQINTMRETHIITLEDPIEYLHQHKRSIVDQREIGVDTGSYALGLRAALREDPDVILLGEMRDAETIRAAVTAAESGHLVLSALHTGDAANAVDCVVEIFPFQQQQQIRSRIENALAAVVFQRLVPDETGERRLADFDVQIMGSV